MKRVDGILDLSWLHDLISGYYCQDNGRPSIDPQSALRLMLAGFFEGIVQDRWLMRRAQTDLASRRGPKHTTDYDAQPNEVLPMSASKPTSPPPPRTLKAWL